MRDLKYLIAYFMPASAVLALTWQGPWSWSTLVLAFGILPLLELFTPESTTNVPAATEDARSRRRFFDFLLYLNAPLLFGILSAYLWTITHSVLSMSEFFGLSLSVGITAGTCGINVAHELGHRSTRSAQVLAQIMLLPSLYQHFFIEHNRGHHKNVATDQDPATARLDEPVFGFWLRSMSGGYRNAWQLEGERLSKAGQSTFNPSNLMLQYTLMQVLWLAGIGSFLGLKALLGAFIVALVSILLLETVNYIEHYGLRRQNLPNGKPEPVSPRHSWNSDHELGRIFLYELTRHSDHHFKSTRKYQILRHLEESPQLPFGYPTSIVLSLCPPLWFRLMNKRVLKQA